MITPLTNTPSRRRRAVSALLCGVLGALVAARAAAQPGSGESPSPSMASHTMVEDPLNRALLFDRLEVNDTDAGTNVRWDASAWVGHAFDRLAIRTEGNETAGKTDQAELQLLWAHTITRWWDLVTGVREDFAPDPSRGWAAFGVQGIAPYRFDIEATAFVGDGGDSAARFKAEYELLVTQRWILQPRIELNWYGQVDAARGLGPGLSSSEVALRLRYEIRREVAPYVGIVRERKHGGTAEFARAAGDEPDDTRLVAGVRLRF
jgi:copper resistance protein B